MNNIQKHYVTEYDTFFIKENVPVNFNGQKIIYFNQQKQLPNILTIFWEQ